MPPVPLNKLQARFARYNSYLDRLRTQGQKHGGSTNLGAYASTYGVPLRLDVYEDSSRTRLYRRVAGQYRGELPDKPPHSVVYGQRNCPAWVPASVETPTSSTFVIGFDDDDCDEWNVRLKVQVDWSTSTELATVRVYAFGYPWNLKNGHVCDLVVGRGLGSSGCGVVMELQNQPWALDYLLLQMDNVPQEAFAGVHFPGRHSFALGHAMETFLNSGYEYLCRAARLQCGYWQDIYDVLSANLDLGFDDYFLFDRSRIAYHDIGTNWGGDENSWMPQWDHFIIDGVEQWVMSGCYSYESRLTARLNLAGVPYYGDGYMELTKGLSAHRMLWMLHLLKKYLDPFRKYSDPRVGSWLSPWIVTGEVDCFDVADEAIQQFEATGGLGMPPVMELASYIPGVQSNKGLGWTTAIFAIYMTVLGYGMGFSRYKAYADQAMVVLGKATWGDNDYPARAGYIKHESLGADSEHVLIYRNSHIGGVMTNWERQPDNPSYFMFSPGGFGKAVVDAVFLAETVTIPLTLPLVQRIEWHRGLMHQTAPDPLLSPTTFETTALSMLATIYYMAYVYDEKAPGWNWSTIRWPRKVYSGLAKNSSGQPISGADVYLVEGNYQGSPDQLTGYVAHAVTRDDGSYSLPYDGAGERTVVVVPTAQHSKKPYTANDPNMHVAFPDTAI